MKVFFLLSSLEISLTFQCSGSVIFSFQPLFAGHSKSGDTARFWVPQAPVRGVLLCSGLSALICGKAKLWPGGNTYVLTAALSGSFWFLPAEVFPSVILNNP